MRTGYNTRPYEKHMEMFQDFSGGLNTVSPPDGMTDRELTDILNQDISERGSLKRRHGLRKVRTLPVGKPQGFFRYYKTDGTYDDIFAINGQLYKNDVATPQTITGLASFQNTRQIEAVQFGPNLYVATGTKLVKYDGTTFTVIDPYLPTTMEMTYIGSNALATNPEGHLQDTTGLVASIDYVLPRFEHQDSRIRLRAKVFFTQISGETYQFAMHYRNISKRGEAWPETHPWAWQTLDVDKCVLGGYPASPGEFELKVVMRKTATTEVLSEWEGSIIVTPAGEEQPKADITVHQCNRILLHWGRLMMYGDPAQPAKLYLSHINTPNYFPSLMNIDFESPRREPITTIVHYRNSLVIFTKSSTQALYGTGPEDYRRVMLHTDIGCVSPNGATVMRNHIGFVSLQGIHALKTLGLTDDKATVEKLDIKIDNIVPKDENALVIFNDNQLQVTYPTSGTRLRFYSELGAWTKDYSTKFSFSGMWNLDGEIYGQRDGALSVFDPEVYTDEEYNYANYFETKNFSFGQPYHSKKLKELQVLTNPNNQRMVATVVVYADDAKVLGVEDSYASVDENGNVIWNVAFESNFVTEEGTTLGEWILGESPFGETTYALKKLKLTGKCKRTRLRFYNEQPNENHFIGFAYMFKIKKP